MNERMFVNAVANGEMDILQVLLDLLKETGTDYCVIGGLAVNAYAEPVVSLDLDIVVAAGNVRKFYEAAMGRGLRVEKSTHIIKLSSPKTDFRIQMHIDQRYQEFLGRSAGSRVLGYVMRVASVDDVLQGKVWAYQDELRLRSKRQKDLADIARLIEVNAAFEKRLPAAVRNALR